MNKHYSLGLFGLLVILVVGYFVGVNFPKWGNGLMSKFRTA